jgi:hypothetical protein
MVRSMARALIYSREARAWMYPQFSRRGIFIGWLLWCEKQGLCSSVDVLLRMAMTAVLLGGRSRDHTIHPWYETRQPQGGHRVSTNITWYELQARRRPAGGCWNLERGGTSPASSLILERNGGSLEGGWCGILIGPRRLLGRNRSWAFSMFHVSVVVDFCFKRAIFCLCFHCKYFN